LTKRAILRIHTSAASASIRKTFAEIRLLVLQLADIFIQLSAIAKDLFAAANSHWVLPESGHSGLNLHFQAIGTRHLFIALHLFTLLRSPL
jgi:hypothetical protein